MPKASKKTASRHETDVFPSGNTWLEARYEELGPYTVGFEMFREDTDATPFLKGLPDDRCQTPHFGYVVQGKITFRYADGEETYEAGDAYYAPPGHSPFIHGGTEIVEFTPTREYAQTLEVLAQNIAASSQP